jgi:formylglycine-generating enzyme required for sulfatase activity
VSDQQRGAAAWLALLFLLVSGVAPAATRHALVIGNGEYASGALVNPVHDAELLRDTLKADGFEVTYLANADRVQMARAIQALGRELTAGGKEAVGLFYFSGHGVQFEGHNFLLPVKASISSDADLPIEAVDADWVLKQMEVARNGLNIVILDACRNNPLPSASRDALKGLAVMQAPVGSVVAFATDAGSVAYDGSGHNSPYAAALARYMSQPGLELEEMFKAVARSVYENTQKHSPPQTPVQTYKLTPTFYFREGQQAPPEQVHPQGPDARAVEFSIWQSALSLGTLEAYRDYLEKYPAGQFSAQAKLHVAALGRPAAGAGLTPPPTGPMPPVPQPGAPAAGSASRDCTDCPEMVKIAPGSFQMGSPASEKDRSDNEGPMHRVDIRYSFWVSKYPITRGEWRQYLSAAGIPGSGNCYGFNQANGQFEQKEEYSWKNPGFPQEDTHPVVCVNWQEAQDYAQWLSHKTGQHYRLLTEAEYEYVNRAGSSSAYWWGASSDQQCSHANGADAAAKVRYPAWTTASCSDGYLFTSPVGHFDANAFGLYDTEGNVFSWTEDCWHDDYQSAPSDGSAWENGGNCAARVVRGGSSYDGPSWLRSASRSGYDVVGGGSVGFRLARTVF